MRSKQRAFTLTELMIVVGVVAVLAMIAYPIYQKQIIKSSRAAAQSQLVELANLEEKIFLNSSLYTGNVTLAYNGQANTGGTPGGLGITTGTTTDGRYTLTLDPALGAAAVAASASFTLTAIPLAGTTQEGDGNLSIDSSGKRLWGSVPF